MKMAPYKKLFTYWFSVIIYDLTVEFCERWIKSWKLKEQMTGAGRSGKQNIVEASDDMDTSLKLAIKMTGTAKGSIEELIGDFEDFLRQRKMLKWEKDDARISEMRARSAAVIRNLSDLSVLGKERETEKLLRSVELPQDLEEAANFLLTLCHQNSLLLHRQVESLKLKHQKEGGFTEKLYQKRKEYRGF